MLAPWLWMKHPNGANHHFEGDEFGFSRRFAREYRDTVQMHLLVIHGTAKLDERN